jgi:hypothetical protein
MPQAEDQRKHLELIQSQISRMSSHSFALKGWSVTLVTAIFAFTTKDADATWLVLVPVVPVVPAVAFWCLDAYYLALERCFIELYEKAASQIREAQSAGATTTGSASDHTIQSNEMAGQVSKAKSPEESPVVASAASATTTGNGHAHTVPLYAMRPEGMGVGAVLRALIRPAVIGLHLPILLIALIGGGYEYLKTAPAPPSLERASRVHVIYSWVPP